MLSDETLERLRQVALERGELRECLMGPDAPLAIPMTTPGVVIGKQVEEWLAKECGVTVTKEGKRAYKLHFKDAAQRDAFLEERFDEDGQGSDSGAGETPDELYIMWYIYGRLIEVDTD